MLAAAIGDLLELPPPVDVRHVTVAKVTVAERLTHLRELLRRGTFTFSEAVARSDRVTVAVTLYALLELHKQGEATWSQPAAVRRDRRSSPRRRRRANTLRPADRDEGTTT